MKYTTILIATLMSAITFAQKKPDASLTLDSSITNLDIHNTTGNLVVSTGGGVYGIDGLTGKEIWNFKESSLISGLNALGQDGGSSFSEIPYSHLGKFKQTIFNIKTGKIIIDGKKNGLKKFIGNQLVLSPNSILFFAKTDKKDAKLFLVDIANDSKIWESSITSAKNLNSLLKGGGITNFVHNDDKIAFSAGKSLFILNKKDGSVICSDKYDAGRLFFSEDNKSLIAVENKSGSLIGGALKAGLTMGISLLGNNPLGDELVAYDVNTGKKVWKKPLELKEGYLNHQFIDNKLFVIHTDGAKLYDYTTGKKVWKKDFKRKKVKSIEKTNEGFLVYYKTKKHLVDNLGKKIWKKPVKIIKDAKFELDDEEDFVSYQYNSGVIFVTPFRIEYYEKGNEKKTYKINLSEDDKLAYDKKNKNIVLLKGKKLYIINPDNNKGKDQAVKIKFKEKKRISSIEARQNGYFINSDWEYVITDFNGKVVKQANYKQPGEGLRHLKNFAGAVASIGAAEVTVTTTTSSSKDFVQQQTVERTYHVSKHHKEFAELSEFLYTPDRFSAFKATKNTAFFYTKKDDKKVLLQVNKDNGNVIESFEFGTNKPVYKMDRANNKIYFRKGKDLKIFTYK